MAAVTSPSMVVPAGTGTDHTTRPFWRMIDVAQARGRIPRGTGTTKVVYHPQEGIEGRILESVARFTRLDRTPPSGRSPQGDDAHRRRE